MKRLFLFFCVSLLLNSCFWDKDHCNNTLQIVGTYENNYDKEAKNLLVIKEKGTFEQIFIKNGVTKKNTGTWKLSKESCYVKLNNLKLMHELGKYEKEVFSQSGKYRWNKIMFNEDLRKEFDFYRVEIQ